MRRDWKIDKFNIPQYSLKNIITQNQIFSFAWIHTNFCSTTDDKINILSMTNMLGVFTVCLFNITVPKIPAFHLTMLSFIGQFLTGIVLDWFSGKVFSGTSFWGDGHCYRTIFQYDCRKSSWKKKRKGKNLLGKSQEGRGYSSSNDC